MIYAHHFSNSQILEMVGREFQHRAFWRAFSHLRFLISLAADSSVLLGGIGAGYFGHCWISFSNSVIAATITINPDRSFCFKPTKGCEVTVPAFPKNNPPQTETERIELLKRFDDHAKIVQFALFMIARAEFIFRNG